MNSARTADVAARARRGRLRRPDAVWSAALATAALALSFTVFAELWHDPAGRTLGRHNHSNDPMQAMWNLKWVPWALLHGHDPFHTSALYYPHGVSLSWNTVMPTLGLIAAPVTAVAGATFTYSLLMLLSPVLSSLTGFWWLRRYVSHRGAAAAGGLLIGFSPFVVGHLQGHLNLVFVAAIPLLLMLVEDLLWRHPRPQRRTVVYLGVVAAAQAGISEELLLITAIGAAVLVATLALADERARPLLVAGLRPFGTAVGVFAICASPLLVHQLLLSPHLNLDSNRYRALPADYVWSLGATVFGWHHPYRTLLGGAEDGVYMGPLLLACLVAGVVATWREVVVRCAAITAGALALLTFGDASPAGIPLPWKVFGHLPILESVLPGRFSFALWLAVAWLVAHWLDRCASALGNSGRPGPRRVPAALAVAALAAALLSLTPRTIPSSALPHVSRFFTAGDARIPEHSPVLLLPAPYSGGAGMYLQQRADFRFCLPSGFALRPSRYGAQYGAPPSPLLDYVEASNRRSATDPTEARDQLEREGYRAVVVDEGLPGADRSVPLVQRMLGRPADRADDGVLIWYLEPARPGHC